jgi:hypothetical protein
LRTLKKKNHFNPRSNEQISPSLSWSSFALVHAGLGAGAKLQRYISKTKNRVFSLPSQTTGQQKNKKVFSDVQSSAKEEKIPYFLSCWCIVAVWHRPLAPHARARRRISSMKGKFAHYFVDWNDFFFLTYAKLEHFWFFVLFSFITFLRAFEITMNFMVWYIYSMIIYYICVNTSIFEPNVVEKTNMQKYWNCYVRIYTPKLF